ncbi:endothelin-converting enzyme 1-like protein [Euroglyphus maynei]|uniref:Endothelin-converting enzyme 1-like protein n=1 Tax=Euroglyphus maynei TaxID=6958 RepID=A0A1Y3BGM4_EURMA|nr:endothelin-converting enzyme 1-like protein [Euroglyphus maynei]
MERTTKRPTNGHRTGIAGNDDIDPQEHDSLAFDETDLDNDDPDVLKEKKIQLKMELDDGCDQRRPVTNPMTNNNRFQANISKIMNNRHQRIQAFLLLIIFILGLTLLIIGIKVLIETFSHEQPICDSSDCLFSAARIAAKISHTTTNKQQQQPCDNFYEFACGQWIDDHPLDEYQGQYSTVDEIKDQIYRDLKHYLDRILLTIPHDDPFYKTKFFYESCMNLEEIDRNSFDYFKHEIIDAGGWNIIGNWHGPSWHPDLALEKLQTYYDVDAFFRVTIGADDLDPQLPFIIKIYPSGIGLPRSYYFDPEHKSIVDAYKQYMSETVKIFGATKLDASQFAENTFNYEKRIAEIMPDRVDYGHPSEMFQRRFSIRELKIIAPSIKWLNLLQKYFEKARLNDNTRVLLAFDSYFRNISNIISTTDSKGLNDYLIWKMISSYAPSLSKEFRIIHYNFQQAYHSLPSLNFINDDDRWRFCLETTSKYLGHALSALYVNNQLKQIMNRSSEARLNIVNNVQRTILNNYDSFIWYDHESDADESRKLINMKLKQMEIYVGHPQFLLKPQLAGYYAEFFTGIKFLHNIIEGINFRHKKMEMLLNQKNFDHAWPLEAYDVDIRYDYAANRLFLPAAILQLPYYDQQAPMAIQFASLGFHVASHMLKAFDLNGLYYNLPDGRLSNNRKFVENIDLNRGLRCLSRQINSISNQVIN